MHAAEGLFIQEQLPFRDPDAVGIADERRHRQFPAERGARNGGQFFIFRFPIYFTTGCWPGARLAEPDMTAAANRPSAAQAIQ